MIKNLAELEHGLKNIVAVKVMEKEHLENRLALFQDLLELVKLARKNEAEKAPEKKE